VNDVDLFVFAPLVVLCVNREEYHILTAPEAVAMCHAVDFKDITDAVVTSARILTLADVDLGLWDRTP